MTHDHDISPLTRLVARLDRATAGEADLDLIATNFPSLDKALAGGVRRGDLVVLGGDDSAGCSALALGIALRLQHRALFLTSEMHPDRVYERALANSARVSLENIRMGTISDEERTRLATAAVSLRDQAPVVETFTDGGLPRIAAAIDATPAARLVIIDTLEGILHRDHGHDEALSYAVVALKRIALLKNIAVLLTTHLPGLDRSRADRRPCLTDFGIGGAVGAQADLVLALYREELYDFDHGVSGGAELLILKNRDGARGYVDLFFETRYGRFEDVAE
ncbi:DnaB-like helicase C-terminal domain-containing protein [Gemmatimonas sp.]|uniref:DnaB-like helicase C-terminal domain-containing protein n=1 Tax=Gemmatimonas sp. TaxID=1962908 RepID=UPI00334205FF